jgi:hypothetical protein
MNASPDTSSSVVFPMMSGYASSSNPHSIIIGRRFSCCCAIRADLSRSISGENPPKFPAVDKKSEKIGSLRMQRRARPSSEKIDHRSLTFDFVSCSDSSNDKTMRGRLDPLVVVGRLPSSMMNPQASSAADTTASVASIFTSYV